MNVKKVAKVLSVSLGGLFLAFLVYANWEEKPLSADVPPMSLVILSAAQPIDSLQFEQVQTWLSEQPGVRAVGGQAADQQLAISIDPNETAGQNLLSALQTQGYAFKPTTFAAADPNTPQCPVPMEYIQAFQKITYAFNFR
ncbi:MAG: hypothetical protein ACK4LB_11540 [Spirosomataceae bacterium]